MAKPSRSKGNTRQQAADPGGLWHQPTLMNLIADVLIVAAVAGLSWAALAALQRLPLFPLREVVLTAAPQQVSAEQIAHAARTAVVGNFFTVDLEAARTAFEKLPWVRNAAVRRQWPDGLSLTLEEHEAVARWRHASGEQGLVNRQGEVFVAELADAAGLPRLTGPTGSAAEMLARHAEFSAALSGIGRSIVAVSLSPRRAWQLKLDDGIAFKIPAGSVIGEGAMDWQETFRLCETTQNTEGYVVEEGSEDGSGFDIPRRSLEALRRLGR